jgi:hypothetical protein
MHDGTNVDIGTDGRHRPIGDLPNITRGHSVAERCALHIEDRIHRRNGHAEALSGITVHHGA